MSQKTGDAVHKKAKRVRRGISAQNAALKGEKRGFGGCIANEERAGGVPILAGANVVKFGDNPAAEC
jgi:hypothetical protein